MEGVMAPSLKTLSLSSGKLMAQVRDLNPMEGGELPLIALAPVHLAV